MNKRYLVVTELSNFPKVNEVAHTKSAAEKRAINSAKKTGKRVEVYVLVSAFGAPSAPVERLPIVDIEADAIGVSNNLGCKREIPLTPIYDGSEKQYHPHDIPDDEMGKETPEPFPQD